MATKERKATTVPLNWKEVYYTNCPMVAANNIDQEMGWCKDDFKKLHDLVHSRFSSINCESNSHPP